MMRIAPESGPAWPISSQILLPAWSSWQLPPGDHSKTPSWGMVLRSQRLDVLVVLTSLTISSLGFCKSPQFTRLGYLLRTRTQDLDVPVVPTLPAHSKSVLRKLPGYITLGYILETRIQDQDVLVVPTSLTISRQVLRKSPRCTKLGHSLNAQISRLGSTSSAHVNQCGKGGSSQA